MQYTAFKTKKMSKETKKIAADVAVQELESFLKIHMKKEFRRGNMDREKIEDEFPDVIEAIEDGLLVFNEKNQPTYKLRYPLFEKAENQDLVVKEVSFRTRIKGADKSVLLDGLDPKKQVGTYIVKIISYITQLSITEVKELEREDYDTLNQLCSVF